MTTYARSNQVTQLRIDPLPATDGRVVLALIDWIRTARNLVAAGEATLAQLYAERSMLTRSMLILYGLDPEQHEFSLREAVGTFIIKAVPFKSEAYSPDELAAEFAALHQASTAEGGLELLEQAAGRLNARLKDF